MSPPPHDHGPPPVVEHADLDDGNQDVQALYDAIEQLTDQQRADFLGVARWNCPFGCGTHSDTVSGIRRHITRISDGEHAHEAGRTPSRPIPGFSFDGDSIAIITAADAPEHSRVLPGQPDPESPQPVVPLTPSTAEAITDPITELQPRPAPHKGPIEPLALDDVTEDNLRIGDTFTRWVCGLCGDYTADSADELNGHIHARDDDTHANPGEVQLAGLLMGVDQQVYAALRYDGTTPRIAPPPRGGEYPGITLPPHWELKSRYETVPPAKLDVDYWDCPYCKYQNDDVDAIRRHITQQGGDHKGHSGHYPDTIISGYRDDVQIGLITPANRGDPNDESVVLAYEVPAVSDPQVLLLEDADTAKATAQEALDELGVDYLLTDQDLASVLHLDPATIDELRSLLEELPPIVRERGRSGERIEVLELALGAHVAGHLRSGFALRAFAATDATTATPRDIPDEPITDVMQRLTTGIDEMDVVETAENGTVYFRVIPLSSQDSPVAVPPEPEMVAVDTTQLADLQETIEDLEGLLDDERSGTDSQSDGSTAKLEKLEKAKAFLQEHFGVGFESS